MSTATPPPSAPDVFRISYPSEIRTIRADGKLPVVTGKIFYDVRSKPIYGMFVEIVRRGAFARALRGEDDPRGLVNHDDAKVIGRLSARTLRLFDESDGLRYEIDVPDTSFGKDLVISVDRGDVKESSFGFRKIKDLWSEERTKDGLLLDIRELLEVELFDLSPVAFPAYPDNTVARRCIEQRRAEKASASNHGAGAARLRKLRLRQHESEI